LPSNSCGQSPPKEISDLAAICLHQDPDSRPNIEQVLAILEKFDIDQDPEALVGTQQSNILVFFVGDDCERIDSGWISTTM